MAITTLFLTGVEISARMYRGLITDLFGEGIRNVAGNEFRVIPRAAGANMTVTIQKGTGEDAVAYIKGDDVTGQGTYRITSDTDFPDLGIAAAPASGTRTDLVVLEVVDSQIVGGSTNLSRFRVLTGVSALTTEKTVIPLARISVPAGATSIQAANITDLRTIATGGGAAVRTAAEVLTQTQIDALTTAQKYRGRLIENSTIGRLQHVAVDGAAPVDVGPIPPAVGSVNPPQTTVSQSTWFSIQVFIGLGYLEVDFALTRTNLPLNGLRCFAAGSAANAMGATYNGTATVLFHPQNSTDSSAGFSLTQTDASNANYVARNVVYNSSTGYLSMELMTTNAVNAPLSSSSNRIAWRAR